jgi:hypothetical protein
MTAPRRLIETTGQHIHGVLEMMPFTVASLCIATHWDKLYAIPRHPRSRDIRLRLKRPRASAAQIAALLSAITLFDFAPHVEELWRCLATQRKGLRNRGAHLPCSASSGAARSTGKPSSFHASNPPESGRTFVKPARFNCSATRALVASFGQVQ